MIAFKVDWNNNASSSEVPLDDESLQSTVSVGEAY